MANTRVTLSTESRDVAAQIIEAPAPSSPINKEKLRQEATKPTARRGRHGSVDYPRMHFFRGKFRLLGHYVHIELVALMMVELAIIALAAYTTLSMASISLAEASQSWIAIMMGSMLVCLFSLGLYDARQRDELTGICFRLTLASIMAYVPIALYVGISADPTPGLYGITAAFLVSLLLLMLVRATFHNHIDGNALPRRVLVLGTGKRARYIDQMRRKSDQRGFNLLGFVPCNSCQHCYVDSAKLLDLGSSLRDYALANRVDEIVIALDDRRAGLPTDDLLDCRMSGIEVSDDLNFFEREGGLIQLDLIQPGWLIYAQGFSSHFFRYLEKRLFDVVGSALLLVALSPLALATAVAIMIECGVRAPVLYRQQRVGKGGREFTIYKFRSMSTDAEADGKAKWACAGDARITRVGNIIRKYRLDEIPQLWNIFRGDMSLVGPRPERPEFCDDLYEVNKFYKERHRVPPGLTGWAQMCYPYGASEKDSIEKLKYDLYYVKNHGFFFDLYILIQTVEVVLFKKGSR